MEDFNTFKIMNKLKVENFKEHKEASEYSGCEYSINGFKFIQRTAKLTPKKVGQFVTLWKRNDQGITAPIDESDKVDFLVIICHQEDQVGHFLFPKEVLQNKGIISNHKESIEGKRGFRIYPLWDMPTSKQAVLTKNWQIDYFTHGLKCNFK